MPAGLGPGNSQNHNDSGDEGDIEEDGDAGGQRMVLDQLRDPLSVGLTPPPQSPHNTHLDFGIRSLNFDLLPPNFLLQGRRDRQQRYRRKKVKSSRIPSNTFLQRKRARLGEETYRRLKDGEINIYQALGPNYCIEDDEDKGLLFTTPRAPSQAAFNSALHCHYQLLLLESKEEFPNGVPPSEALRYDGSNPPSPTRFGMAWNESSASPWNLASRNFLARDFALHHLQYLRYYDLPEEAAIPAEIYKRFTVLIKNLKKRALEEERQQSMDERARLARSRRLDTAAQNKFVARLKVVDQVQELALYLPLMKEIGVSGMSDEETDVEAHRVSFNTKCRIVYDPQYRSASYGNFMHLVDDIKALQDRSIHLHPDANKRSNILAKQVVKKRGNRCSTREVPLGKPWILYSEEYAECMAGIGINLNPTHHYQHLSFPPKLSANLIRNLGYDPSLPRSAPFPSM